MITIKKPLILLIECDKIISKYLNQIFITQNFEIVIVTDVYAAIRKIIECSPDVIICNTVLNGYTGFQIYNLLENSILTTGIPFVLIMKEFNEVDIEMGLELGIDNFIFQPFYENRIIKKVNTILSKIDKHKALEVERFEKLFTHSPVAIAEICNNRIKRVNRAFRDLAGIKEFNANQYHLEDYFEMENNMLLKNSLQRCLKGLDSVCSVKGIQVKNSDVYVDLYMVQINKGVNSCALIQFVESEEINRIVSNGKNDWSISTYLQARKRMAITENEHNDLLTDREIQITTLSAKGYQIKEIADKLGISSRTVEKHRSNVMRKTGTSNIIEAINKVVDF
ncbi:LuxR C-terminal-related transcriptional regulator [uncultured Draconibacterium sp.]|uniref:LuxR C-terminal-related transcriptional regulator n=1 Tax=uncultured Draconibacterium sp. TaxID=1573823 RepID=UPI003217F446